MESITRQRAARLADPVLHAAGIVPVMLASLVVVSFVERSIGFGDYAPGFVLADATTLRYNGDVVIVAVIVVLGGLVFSGSSRILVWLEGLRTPSLKDHLRHCFVLYAVLGLLSIYLVASYQNSAANGISLGYFLAATCCFVTGHAVLINGLTLVMQRRRVSHQSHRSNA